MKRFFSILTILLVVFLCSCKGVFEKPKTLEKAKKLPKNGIVKSSELTPIKDNNSICVFEGKSGNVYYKWTVFGSDIKTPNDQMLKIEIKEEKNGLLKFNIARDIDFSPMLTLYLNYDWKCDKVSAILNDKVSLTASISKEKNSIINISVKSAGSYCIKAENFEQIQENGEKISAVANNGKTETVNGSVSVEKQPTNEKDKYQTDPVPQGKPLPVDKPSNTENSSEKEEYCCTISIECTSIFNNLEELSVEKLDALPSNGIILEITEFTFNDGDTVYDVLRQVCDYYGIPMESSFTPGYNTAYIEGINNLYEFDCGEGSGWMYRVNGWYPNYGCGRYAVKDGDEIEFRYTCNLGADIGGGNSVD